MQFSDGSAVLCVPVALHMHLSAARLMAKCDCAEGAVPRVCVCLDHSTASVMVVVTLQVPCVMSHLEEIINQVND